MRKNGSSRGGFTLIELLIYLFLAAILARSLFVTAHDIIGASRKAAEVALEDAEAEFVTERISGLFARGTAVVLPAVGRAASSTRFVQGSDVFQISQGADHDLLLQKNSGPNLPLLSSRLKVSNMSFEMLGPSTAKISFSINGGRTMEIIRFLQ